MIPNPLIGMLGPDGIRTQKVPQPGMKEPQKQGGFMFNPQPGTNPVFEAQKLEIKKKNEALQSVIDQLMEGYTKRAAIKMQLPQEQKVNAQDALTAGFIALAAQLAGARPEYAQKGFQGFMQGSQSIADSNNARNLAQAQLDYQNRTGMADANIQGLQERAKGAQAEYRGAIDQYQTDVDFATQQAKLAEDARQFDSSEERKKQTAANKLEFDKYKLEFGAELQKFLNANPRELMIAKGLYDEALAKGFSPEEARSMAFADSIKKVEEAKLTGAKTNTEDALRPGKVEKQAAEIEKIYADVKVKESQSRLIDANVKLKNGESAAKAQDRVLTGEPIGDDDIKSLYKLEYELEDKIKSAKDRVAELKKSSLDGFDPIQTPKMLVEMATLQQQIPAMELEKELNKNALIKAKARLKKSGSSGNEPMAPLMGNLKPTNEPSIQGALSGRGMGTRK